MCSFSEKYSSLYQRLSTKHEKAIETLFAENFGLRKSDKGLYFMQCGSVQDSSH